MTKSLGGVFSSAWNTAKKNLLALFVPTAIYLGILFLLYGVYYAGMVSDLPVTIMTGTVRQTAMMWISPVMFGVSVFLAPLYSGYITAVLRTYHVTGVPAPMGAAWKAACANYTKYLLTMLTQILFGFIFGLVVAVVVLIIFFATVFPSLMQWTVYSPDAWYAVVLILSAMVPAIIVAAVLGWIFEFSLTFLNFIPGMENQQGFKAFFSSFRYIYQGNLLKNLGHILLAGLIQSLIVGLIAVICFLPFFMNVGMNIDSIVSAEQVLDPLIWSMPLYMAVGGIASILLSVFFTPYYFEVYLNAKTETERKQAAKNAAMAMRYPYQGQ
ncbi:MAG: hypothetical protein VB081_05715 [Christensenella sp.]|uniref:hypothetical protein n=1 Tax=Christensenella sp. TaxID=1935934 RepID=UPI002B1EC317|nr:hypothetical protein [Christensenella sp.]MEA5002978.1 hypothetical protein [Christensenella sp.]